MKNISLTYIALGLLISFVSLCGLRAGATPIEDYKGGFPDELFHFARSLQSTMVIAESMSISIPDLDANSLMKFSTRVDNICELGYEYRPGCPDYYETIKHNLFPFGSGKIRGSGVYLMHGLIQLLLPEVSVQSRLIFGRVFAICIGVALIYVVYGLANLLFNDNRLSIASAALVGLMPSVSNIISAVSTEGPALLAVGILLLSSANIAIRGYSLPRSLMFCLGVAACLFTKMTAIVSLPIAALLLLQKAGFRWRWILLTSLFGFTIIAVTYRMYVPENAGVAHWYMERDPGEVSIHGTPAKLAHQNYTRSFSRYSDGYMDNFGSYSMSSSFLDQHNCISSVSTSDTISKPLYFYEWQDCATVYNWPILQFLPNNVASNLAGKIITVGSWVIVPEGVVFQSPQIVLAYDNSIQELWEGKRYTGIGGWQFVSYEKKIPENVSEIAVRLYVPGKFSFWDSVILAEGSFADSARPPVFDDVTAASGQWSGSRFTNLLKNGSGEKTWAGVPSVIDDLMNKYGSGTWANRLNGQLFTLYDFERTSTGYIDGLRAIFVTFWGSFAGGDWPGLARWHYVVAIGFLMLSVAGWMRYAWLHSVIKPVVPQSIALPLFLLLVLYIVVGLLRMEVSAEWSPPLYYATARFLLPAIIPVVLLGLAGIDLLNSKKISRLVIAALVVAVFMANTWMLLRVELPYFNCTSETRWTCTDL